MAREFEGKVAVVTGAASGIGLASTEAMLAAGSRVVMVDRDEAALKVLCNKHGDAVIPLVIDLLDPKDCATLLPRVLEKVGQLDILHANAGTYVGGDLVDADTGAIDRMPNLNVNVVMKNVHDVLPHMIERRTGDIIVTSSLAAHFPTPWAGPQISNEREMERSHSPVLTPCTRRMMSSNEFRSRLRARDPVRSVRR